MGADVAGPRLPLDSVVIFGLTWRQLLDQVQEAISEGGMPPIKYTLPHPSTKLSSDEKARLIAGLAALYGQDPLGP